MDKQIVRICVAHQIRQVFISPKVGFLESIRVAKPNTTQVAVRVFILNLELKPTMQERSLKAFLDLAILCALTDHPMTGYEINRLFLKKHRIFIGPSTIYSKLATMERKAWIKCVRNRAGRVCSLTEKGRKITADATGITREIQGFIRTILKSHDHTPPKQ
jgi:DNA-binding PadR family transcriptional regulator